jgi:hypothetical protein
MQIYTICTATTNDAVPIYSSYMLRKLMHMYSINSATDDVRTCNACGLSRHDNEVIQLQVYTMCTEYVQEYDDEL